VHESSADADADREQYLTFLSAGQNYAIPIMRMREIVPYKGSTQVPFAPRGVRGLINLRGRAIPVVDLSVRLGEAEMVATKRTCVLIVDLDDDVGRPDLGILADSVDCVVDVGRSELEDTPSFGVGIASEYLQGMLRSGDGFIPIIAVGELLRAEHGSDWTLTDGLDGAVGESDGAVADVSDTTA
jgi:purine-binding chemotaxis protein CheW